MAFVGLQSRPTYAGVSPALSGIHPVALARNISRTPAFPRCQGTPRTQRICRMPPAQAKKTAIRAPLALPPVPGPSESKPRGPVLVIDNYDSFTYNLCQYLGDIGCPYEVITNDERTVDEIVASNPAGILLSPGPGTPDDSGVTMEVAARLGAAGYPIFGVCMGLQCIGQAAGGNIVRAPSGVMHGKASLVWHSDVGVLRGLPNPFRAARYHSLVIDKDTCPDSLEVTAWCEDGTIMAARHREHPNVEGVQFHPESIITENGMVIMKNFVDSLELHRMNVVA